MANLMKQHCHCPATDTDFASCFCANAMDFFFMCACFVCGCNIRSPAKLVNIEYAYYTHFYSSAPRWREGGIPRRDAQVNSVH